MLMGFLKNIIQNRRMLVSLAVHDFRSRYFGSYLGFVWAFVNPIVTISIFWFVFEVGFKAMPVDDFPFILWLMAGMIPWFYFAESLGGATNAILDNSYLVKKVVFRVSILPLVKILSALGLHLFFVIFLFVVFTLYGYTPGLQSLQVLYYFSGMFLLLCGLSWITSSLVVFMKDVGYVVNTMLQFGFWLTPIFWSLGMIPEKYHKFMKLNPVFYITEGYRNSFVYDKWFWESPLWTVYFWCFVCFSLVAGGLVFRRLRPHFADVL